MFKLYLGLPVKTTMGVRRTGTVINPIPANQYTDGSYRAPEKHETAVYVQWSDGTKGWSHRQHLDLLQTTVKVGFADGNSLVSTINGTEEQARAYYLGKKFNLGVTEDNMTEATSVEIL